MVVGKAVLSQAFGLKGNQGTAVKLITRCVVCVTLMIGLTQSVKADTTPISVGSGDNHANVYIEFQDSATYLFDVAFDSDSTTGLGLFDIIEAETSLVTVRDDFGWGAFIDGISYDGHSNSGYLGGEDWWHYWVMDPINPVWISPGYGVADRIIVDGASDGWIYGRAGAPVPEPATAMLLAFSGAIAFRTRRQKGQSGR